jgi:hypothetical protein
MNIRILKSSLSVFMVFASIWAKKMMMKGKKSSGRREMRLEMTGEENMFAGLRHCFGIGI